ADRLRRSRKPVLIVANKSDSWRGEAQAAEFYALGLGDVHTVSAMQGTGTGDLLDAVVAALPAEEASEEEYDARVAIIGRPNVGKSSFLNALVGEQRAVVSEIPGTTPDTRSRPAWGWCSPSTSGMLSIAAWRRPNVSGPTWRASSTSRPG